MYGARSRKAPDEQKLPTMAVDQYAATLANWFGVSAGDMATVLPNIGNYDASTRNVGFLG